jgi:hypothetical protein
LKNPTNLESGDSSASSSVAHLRTSNSTPAIGGGDPSLAPAPPQPPTGIGPDIHSTGAGPAAGLPSGLLEPTYEVFDPLNWMLDGLIEFPYSYNAMHGLEQGVA